MARKSTNKTVAKGGASVQGSGQVRIVAGEWRGRKLPVATYPACGPLLIGFGKQYSTGYRPIFREPGFWTASVVQALWRSKPYPEAQKKL